MLKHIMIPFLYYPLYLFVFWYKDVVVGLFSFFVVFNSYVASLLSFSNLLRTFFKPLKNEYREGLVFFSICFGVVIKTVLLSVSAVILFCILLIEVLVILFLITLPILLFMLLVSPRTILR